VIELVDITQHYGVRPVLRGISLRIERGEVVTILGPNGMGKTTLLGVMAGVLAPQHGSKGDSPIRTFSAGQKKKVALCSALVAEVPILLLDEPFSGGLDPAGLLTLKRIIQRHAQRNDATIVLTSPVPELVEEVTTRIIVLHHGEVLAFDTIDGLQRMTGHRGSLGAVLERLMFPDTTRKLEAYFQEFA
jgi:ABC-type multidrug transport system ATPase subunit